MAADFNFRCSITTTQTTKLLCITIFLLLKDGLLPVSSLKFGNIFIIIFFKYIVLYSLLTFIEDTKEKFESLESLPKGVNNLDSKDRKMVIRFRNYKSMLLNLNSIEYKR